MHEWPLLIFTLLLQGAVGLTLWLVVTRWSAKTQGKYALLPVFCVCLLAGIGLLASVFHLGYPLNAFNALRHLSSSWLSREILFASLFLALAGLCFLALLCKQVWGTLFLPLALLLGAIDVFCMSEIYMQTAIVTWTHANTLVMFYGTVGIVGTVVASALLRLQNTAFIRCAAALIVAVVLIRLAVQIPYMSWLAQAGLNDALTFPHEPLTAFRALESLRMTGWTLSIVGALVFTIGALRRRKAWLCAGSLLLLAAEVLLRFAFFSIH